MQVCWLCGAEDEALVGVCPCSVCDRRLMLAMFATRGQVHFGAARAAARATRRLAPIAGRCWRDAAEDEAWLRHYQNALDWPTRGRSRPDLAWSPMALGRVAR